MPNSGSNSPTRSWTSLPRPILVTVAILFCATATLYAAVWMSNARNALMVELGFNRTIAEEYDQQKHSIFVADVLPASPSEQMGLRAGDRIIGVNGELLVTSAPYDEAYKKGRPGDPVEMTVKRPGESKALELHGLSGALPSGGIFGVVSADRGSLRMAARSHVHRFCSRSRYREPDASATVGARICTGVSRCVGRNAQRAVLFVLRAVPQALAAGSAISVA